MIHIKHSLILACFLTFMAMPSLCSSLSVSLSSPSEVEFNNPFSVEVSADTSDIYDVKIYVKNSSDSILSDTEGESWKSSIYYVNDAFPSKTEFNIRVEKFSEDAQICVKLRLSSKRSSSSPTPERCNPLAIIEAQDSEPEEQEQQEEEVSSDADSVQQDSSSSEESQPPQSSEFSEDQANHEQSSESRDSSAKTSPSLPKNKSFPQKNSDSVINSEVISISPPPINSSSAQNSFSYISPQQKTRLIILYLLTFIVLVVVILIMLRKL